MLPAVAGGVANENPPAGLAVVLGAGNIEEPEDGKLKEEGAAVEAAGPVVFFALPAPRPKNDGTAD